MINLVISGEQFLSIENVRGPIIFCLISGPRAALVLFRILPAFFRKNLLSVFGELYDAKYAAIKRNFE